MYFFFIQKSAKRCHIFLGLLVMQSLYINGFFILIEQYFSNTFGSILELCKGFWNTLFTYPKMFFIMFMLWCFGFYITIGHIRYISGTFSGWQLDNGYCKYNLCQSFSAITNFRNIWNACSTDQLDLFS